MAKVFHKSWCGEFECVEKRRAYPVPLPPHQTRKAWVRGPPACGSRYVMVLGTARGTAESLGCDPLATIVEQ